MSWTIIIIKIVIFVGFLFVVRCDRMNRNVCVVSESEFWRSDLKNDKRKHFDCVFAKKSINFIGFYFFVCKCELCTQIFCACTYVIHYNFNSKHTQLKVRLCTPSRQRIATKQFTINKHTNNVRDGTHAKRVPCQCFLRLILAKRKPFSWLLFLSEKVKIK